MDTYLQSRFLKLCNLLFNTQIIISLQLSQGRYKNASVFFSGHMQPSPAARDSPTAQRPTPQQISDGTQALNKRNQVSPMR